MMIAAMTMADLDDDARWRIALAKDRRFDGQFVTGVLSTGIYCRPSCPARAPLRANVRFFASPGEAEAAGLRACRRCRPNAIARDEAAVKKALATLDAAEVQVALSDLAQVVGYSPTHLQKLFTRAVGISPAGYARARRRERMADRLTNEGSVTGALYEAGYGAPSRFYAESDRLGMAPSAWRDGGRGVTIRWAVVPTSFGAMLLAATERGICRLSFNEDRSALERRFPQAELIEGGGEFVALLDRAIAAVEAPGSDTTIPLDVQGTAFQEAVWAALQQIPPGETRSYAELAAAIGRPGAVRAAGSANGANAVAVLIPCHRVVRSDGSVGGYAYGISIKEELLRRERDG